MNSFLRLHFLKLDGIFHYTDKLFEECKKSSPDINSIKKLIQKGVDPKSQDTDKNTCLHWLAKAPNPNMTIVNYFIEQGVALHALNAKGNTFLHEHCTLQIPNTLFIKTILLKGFDPYTVNKNGDTCLHLLLRQYGLNRHDIVRDFIEHGAAINAVNKFGATYLQLLCYEPDRYIKTIEYLLDKNADVNLIDGNKRTCLVILCKSKNVNLQYLKLLIRHGADLKVRDSDEKTLLQLVCSNETTSEEVIQYLINQEMEIGEGCLASLLNWPTPNLPTIKLILERGFDFSNKGLESLSKGRFFFLIFILIFK